MSTYADMYMDNNPDRDPPPDGHCPRDSRHNTVPVSGRLHVVRCIQCQKMYDDEGYIVSAPDADEDEVDYDDYYNNGGNPDLDEISGNRP